MPSDRIEFLVGQESKMFRQVALRSFKDLCAFIGAIALFSYFFNWAADLRHWYFTLASALFCLILWLGFYVIESLGGVRQVFTEIASRYSHLRTQPELPFPRRETPEPAPADPPAAAAEPPVTKPNPPAWLKPRRTVEGDTAEKNRSLIDG